MGFRGIFVVLGIKKMRRVEHGACAVKSGTVLEAAARRRYIRMRIDKSAKGARTQNKLYCKHTVASFGEDTNR